MTSDSNTRVCQGLDGRNPQHFLAALGLQRAGCAVAEKDGRRENAFKLSWTQNGSCWHPVISAENIENTLQQIPDFLHYFARYEFAHLQKVREANQTADQIKHTKNPEEKSRLNAKKAKLQEEISLLANRDDPAHLNSLGITLTGSGAFEFSDVIGTDPINFRKAVISVQEQLFNGANYAEISAGEISSLGSDLILNGGKVAPTVFSFSNGNSGKCLLKDARNCMAWVSQANLDEALSGNWKVAEARGNQVPKGAKFPTSLNWSPEALVSHALSAEDPTQTENVSIPAIEALSFWGLSQFPCFPTAAGLAIPCLKKGRVRGWLFSWPIWTAPLSQREVFWLLSRFDPNSSSKPAGIAAEFQVRTINPNGKRNYFSSSYLPEHAK